MTTHKAAGRNIVGFFCTHCPLQPINPPNGAKGELNFVPGGAIAKFALCKARVIDSRFWAMVDTSQTHHALIAYPFWLLRFGIDFDRMQRAMFGARAAPRARIGDVQISRVTHQFIHHA